MVSAIIDGRKLTEYCLNTQHPRGRNKARVFASVGILAADAEDLRAAIAAAAVDGEAQSGRECAYGRRYILDFELVRADKTIRVRSTWIVRKDEDLPRLTSCYVL